MTNAHTISLSTEDDPRVHRVIRDPVHDYIEMPIELNLLVDDPLVQRLRRVSQTAQASSVFPSMTGFRFEHSLGTMHLAQYAWTSMWSRMSDHMQKAFCANAYDFLAARPKLLDRYTREWIADRSSFDGRFERVIKVAVAASGLLHDLGHPPYSHALEGFYDRNFQDIVGRVLEPLEFESFKSQLIPFHERAGLVLVDELPSVVWQHAAKYVVTEILRASDRDDDWLSALHSIVSSDVDVDRLDYLVRDAGRAGTEFGSFDLTRLIQSVELHDLSTTSITDLHSRKWRVGYGYRARTAIESMLTNRMRYYHWVLFHPHVAAENKFLDLALEQILDIGRLVDSELRDGDSEVVRAFRFRVPHLNYIQRQRFLAPDKREDPDDRQVRAEVDDASIDRWMTDSASLARAARGLGKTSEKMSLRLDRYLALYGATRMRSSNWTPLWKTEDDYEEIAESISAPMLRVLEQQIAEGTALVSRAISEGQDDDLNHWKLIMNRLTALGTQFSASAADEPYAIRMNSLAKFILYDKTPAIRYARERQLSQIMGNAATVPAELRFGEWVFVFDEITPVRTGSGGTSVWKRNVPSPITEISSTARSLNGIAAMFPHFFAYYLAHTPSLQVRVGRSSPFLPDLRNAFCEAFPGAVSAMLSGILQEHFLR